MKGKRAGFKCPDGKSNHLRLSGIKSKFATAQEHGGYNVRLLFFYFVFSRGLPRFWGSGLWALISCIPLWSVQLYVWSMYGLHTPYIVPSTPYRVPSIGIFSTEDC